ncbi:DnaJ domain-containing protein [Saccharibacter floricola]|nr:DnaJ domain-containing protein [Saccharibacter floricola]
MKKSCLNFILICIVTFTLSGSALSKSYSPDFDCYKIDHSSYILVLLCSDPESARSELILDQAYYALRHQSPAYLLPQLKNTFITDSQIVQTCFPDPDEGESPAQCYRQKTARITDKYRSLLMPRAYEEATRSIDAHMALQQRLVDLGYLPPTTKIDGVYGADTRRAILRWQEKTGQSHQDGFLGREDELRLAPSLVQFTNFSHLDQLSLSSEAAPIPSENRTEMTPPSHLSENHTQEGEQNSEGDIGQRYRLSRKEVSSPVNEDNHYDSSKYGPSSNKYRELLSDNNKNKSNNFFGFISIIIVVSSLFLLLFITSIRVITKKYAEVTSSEGGGRSSKQEGPSSNKEHKASMSSKEQKAYQEAGMLWGRWADDHKEGEKLLKLLIQQNIEESFAFLERLLSPLETNESQKILSDVLQGKKTRRWEEFCRCSYQVLEYLLRYEQEQAEAEDRKRRQKEGAKKQRQQREHSRQRHKHSSSSAGAALWYVVLGVSERATLVEITTAYRTLLKKHHPDRFLHKGEEAYKAATEMTARLNAAYGYARKMKGGA